MPSPISVTAAPLYTPPVGVPPPRPDCTPASTQRSAGATNVTTGKANTSTSSEAESIQPFASVYV